MDQPTPLQFSLKTILAITAAVSLFFAAGAWFDMPGYVLFVLLAGLAAVFAFSRDFDVFLLGARGLPAFGVRPVLRPGNLDRYAIEPPCQTQHMQ